MEELGEVSPNITTDAARLKDSQVAPGCFRMIIAGGIAVSSLIIGVSIGEENAERTAQAIADENASTTTEIRIERNKTELIPFSEFQAEHIVSQDMIDKIYDAAIQVSIKGGPACSGSIVNGYLLTASHCIGEDGQAPIKVNRWRQGDNEGVGSGGVWASLNSSERDLVVAKLGYSEGLEEVYVPYISNEDPLPGTRMIAVTYPGADRDGPLLGTLTYITSVEYTEQPEKWVFALGPDNSPDAYSSLCDPGSSGSLIIDDQGNLAIQVQIDSRHHMAEQEWEGVIDRYQALSGADLSQVTAFCYATPVKRDVLNSYIDVLET